MNIITWNDLISIFIIGFIVGMLKERWIYFSKTGKHLQDLKKN